MRTLVLIVIGLVLAGLLRGLVPVRHRRSAAWGFCLVWLAVVGWNLATGLSHGYTLAEELPIQALIFLLPAVAAVGLARVGTKQHGQTGQG